MGAARHRGAVAIMVGLSLTALIGFAGLALDLSRLYINKSELQTAADACALAAAAELTCTTGTTGCLINAQYAGKFAALQNKSNLQVGTVAIADADVRFSTAFVPNASYASLAGGAAATSTFSMCIARSAGIVPWFMGTMGVGQQLVAAQAVASLQPAGSGGFCPGAPIGVCPKTGGGAYAVGDWVVANASGTSNSSGLANQVGSYGAAVKGTFRWVDWDYPAGGTSEVQDRLAGTTTLCGVTTASSNIAEEGTKQGAKDGWNTRFGVYPNGANGYSVTTAPPDRTGFSYPTKPSATPYIPVGTSAYSDYRSRQATGAPFQDSTGSGGTYDPQGQGNPQIGGNASSSVSHQSYGTDRRLIATPIISGCTGASHVVTISSVGCFLLLNPMSSGANGDVFMEYRGLAGSPGSPCSGAGAPGGPGGVGGAMVPTLVQ